MASWYYQKQGAIRDDTVGPIDTAALQRRIESGEIVLDTPISSPEKTGSQWVTIKAFPPLVTLHDKAEAARKEAAAAEKAAKADAKANAKAEKAAAKHELAVAKEQAKVEAAKAKAEAIAVSAKPASPFEAGAQPVAAAPMPQYMQPQPQQITIINEVRRESNTVPVLLNMFLSPGIGQIVQGRIFAAMFWFGGWVVSLALCLVLVGFFIAPLVYLGAIIDAAMYRG